MTSSRARGWFWPLLGGPRGDDSGRRRLHPFPHLLRPRSHARVPLAIPVPSPRRLGPGSRSGIPSRPTASPRRATRSISSFISRRSRSGCSCPTSWPTTCGSRSRPAGGLGATCISAADVRRIARLAFGAIAFAVAGPTVVDHELPEPLVVGRVRPVRLLGRWIASRRAAAPTPPRSWPASWRAGARRRAGDVCRDAGDCGPYVTFRAWRARRDRGCSSPRPRPSCSASSSPRSSSCRSPPADARVGAGSWMITDDFWSFHPLAMLRAAGAALLRQLLHSNLSELMWMLALNSNREPFYYTMYFGVPILLAAGVAACSRRPRTTFWAATSSPASSRRWARIPRCIRCCRGSCPASARSGFP